MFHFNASFRTCATYADAQYPSMCGINFTINSTNPMDIRRSIQIISIQNALLGRPNAYIGTSSNLPVMGFISIKPC